MEAEGAGKQEEMNGISAEKLRTNLREWLENPSWREYYETAPSDRCREFIALEFYYSEYGDEAAGRMMDKTENEMDAAELRHLMKYCGNNPRKGMLARKAAERELSPGR